MRRALIALAFALSGCHAWPKRPVTKIGTAGRPIRVVTDEGRRRAVLEGAAVIGDSVIGRLTQIDTLRPTGWVRLRPGGGERSAIAVSDIVEVRHKVPSLNRTILALAVLVAVFYWFVTDFETVGGT